MMCSSQWVYTAFTRAKSFLSIHTDKYSNISKAVRKNAIDEKVTIIELLMK
jgi:ATP-dependent exoDNAse (exonuclease V) alpha subunit